MDTLTIIAKKRDGGKLSKEEIQYFIQGYTKGEITDYQAAALVMAIYIQGMDSEETTHLTLAMADSGEKLNLRFLGQTIIDKHSTGGIGDKVTILLMPIVASLGVPVAKMSGRGLGITGGTVDKLESIPGYQTAIPMEQFIRNIQEIGISLISQTMDLAPADKKLYALRNAINCTESIPLIASSIMSKKIAAGSDKIILDVTVGSGAFMKKKEDAELLARTMIEIGKIAGKETIGILTDMDEPLGKSVGNSMEIQEAIECLKGKREKDVEEVVTVMGAYILKLAGKGEDLEENKKKIIMQMENGEAYQKFLELVEKQGGDSSYIKEPEKWKKASFRYEIITDKQGWIARLDAGKIGEASVELGAGRKKKEDAIDPTVGILLQKKIGDRVKEGDVLAVLYANQKDKLEEAKKLVEKAYEIENKEVIRTSKIIEIIDRK